MHRSLLSRVLSRQVRSTFAAGSGAAAASVPVAANLCTPRRRVVEEYSGSHDQFVAKVAKGKTIVDCYTTWCGPCQLAAPVFAELSEKYKDVKFIKVNVEENEDVGAMLNVRSIPYFVMYDNGKVTGSVEGSNMQRVENLVKGGAK